LAASIYSTAAITRFNVLDRLGPEWEKAVRGLHASGSLR
jgi:hypothetical protein